MSKLPTFGISPKNNFKLQSTTKIGGLKYSSKSFSKSSSFSPKLEANSKNNLHKKTDDYDIAVDDYVFIKSINQKGTVKYVGETKFKTGIWVGVELDKQGAGKNNGTVMGITYFKCPPASGIFIPITAVEKLSRSLELNNNDSEISAISNKNKSSLKNKTKISINTEIKQSNILKSPKFKPKLNGNESISRSLSSTSVKSASEIHSSKKVQVGKRSNSSYSLSKSSTKSKLPPKASALSPKSLKAIYNPQIYSPKINKKLIPLEFKGDDEEMNISTSSNNKETINEYKDNDNNDEVNKRDSIKTIENNDEKFGVELVNDSSGCEDDTIKVNENFETNTNEEALGHFDDDILSEKLSIASTSMYNSSPQDKNHASIPSDYEMNKSIIKFPNSTPASPNYKSSKLFSNPRRFSVDSNEFSVTKKSNYYSPETPEYLKINTTMDKPVNNSDYPKIDRNSIESPITGEHSLLKSPIMKSEDPMNMNYEAQSLTLHQQVESVTDANEENENELEEEEKGKEENAESKSKISTNIFSGRKSNGNEASKSLKSSRSLYLDKNKSSDSLDHSSPLQARNRTISFGSQKSMKFADQESIKDMYEQEKDLMNNTSEEMRYSIDKFQTLIDRLTQQSLANNNNENKNSEDDKDSKTIIAELTHELIKTKEETKELKEKLNKTENKMKSLIGEKESLENIIETIKSKKDSIQQDYQDNMNQLHGDIADKTKKLDDLESKFRYYYEQYNIVSEDYNILKENFDRYAEETRNEKENLEQEFAHSKNQLLMEREDLENEIEEMRKITYQMDQDHLHQIAESEQKLNAANNMAKHYEEQCQELSIQIQAMEKEIYEMDDHHHQVEMHFNNQFNQQEMALEQADEHIKNLEMTIDKLKEERDVLKAESIKKLNGLVEDMEKTLNETDQSEERLKQEIQFLTKQSQEYYDLLSELTEKLDQLEKENEECKVNVINCVNELDRLQNECSELKLELEIEKVEKENFEQESKKLQVENENLKSEMKKLEERLEGQVDKLNEELYQLDEKVLGLNEEKFEFEEKIKTFNELKENLEQQISDKEDECFMYEEEVKQLKVKLEDFKELISLKELELSEKQELLDTSALISQNETKKIK